MTFILINIYEDPNYFFYLFCNFGLILIRMVPSFSNINFAISNLKFFINISKNLVEDLKINNTKEILNSKISQDENFILKRDITISFKNIFFFMIIIKKF